MVFVNSWSQSSSQRRVINNFFERYDVQKTVHIMGHPTPRDAGLSVNRIDNNSVPCEKEEWSPETISKNGAESEKPYE
jgi:hypothetical protein